MKISLKEIQLWLENLKNPQLLPELRNFDKFLCKNVMTRWNSILFLVRSILKISTSELQQIRNNLPTNNKSQRAIKDLFRLSVTDRAMLDELRNLLVLFEFVTNELQTNYISISRVYPCYLYLQNNLIKDLDQYKYTKQIRKDLHSSLEKHFGDLVREKDVFMLSTMLDPNFGKKAIPPHEIAVSGAKLKDRLIKITTLPVVDQDNENFKTISRSEQNRKSNYLFFGNDEVTSPLDDLDTQIHEYFQVIERIKSDQNGKSFETIAKLAKKVLGVPETSAEVERMFSLSGHILGPKRRTTGVQLYEDLVYIKLNEELLD